MAFSMGSSGGTRLGGRRAGGGGTLSEINVVPLVDVVLVLLIIFMVTAQAMEFGLEIQVPQVKTNPQISNEDLPLISLTHDGRLYLSEKPVSNINLMGQEVARRYKDAKTVYVRGDKEVRWDLMANVIAILGDAHYEVRVVTKQFENSK